MGTVSKRAQKGKYQPVSETEKDAGTFKPNEDAPPSGNPVTDAMTQAKKDDEERRKKLLKESALLKGMSEDKE
jgi:hypothetical protein